MLGAANSRLKDFYDLASIAARTTLDGAILARAIAATFARRQTAIPHEPPLALRSAFAAQSVKQNQWLAFLARNRLADLNFGDTIGVLYTLLWPATQVAASSSTANARWAPDQLTWV